MCIVVCVQLSYHFGDDDQGPLFQRSLIYRNGAKEVNLEALDPDNLFDFIDNIPEGNDDDLDDIDEDELEAIDERFNREDETLSKNSVEENYANVFDAEKGETVEQPTSSCNSKELLWTESNIGNVPCTFTGSTKLPDNILKLETPFQLLNFFFDDKLIGIIVEETNKFFNISITINAQ